MNDIHSITLESDETGYTLTIQSDEGTTTGALNDIAAMRDLLKAARYVQSYVDSHDEAFAAWKACAWDNAAGAYDAHNPKHPSFFDMMVDIARTDDRLHREGLK